MNSPEELLNYTKQRNAEILAEIRSNRHAKDVDQAASHLSSATRFFLGINFFIAAARFMTFPFLAIYLSTHNGWSAGQIGLVIGLSPLASMIFGIAGGRLADRFGALSLYVGALLIAAASLVGYGFISTYIGLCIISIISGIAWSVVNTTQRTLLSEVTANENLEQAFLLNYWTFNLGGILGPLLGAWLGAGETTTPFIVFAGLLFFITPVTFGIVRRFSLKRATETATRPVVSSFHQIFQLPGIMWLLISTLCVFAVEAQFETNIAQYLSQSLDDGVRLFSRLLMLAAFGVVVLQPLISLILKKLSAVLVVAMGTLSYVLAPLTILLFPEPNIWYVYVVLVTLGELLVAPKMQATLARLSSDNSRNTVFAMFGFSGNLAYFLGPWMGGLLLETYGASSLLVIMSFLGVLVGVGVTASLNTSDSFKDQDSQRQGHERK